MINIDQSNKRNISEINFGIVENKTKKYIRYDQQKKKKNYSCISISK